MPLPPPSVSLAVVVQHHPKRARLLDSLLPALGECDVISDPNPDGPPSAIRTYLACLRAMPPWATHLLVIQDDARPCADFRGRARRAVIWKPETLLALFLGGAPARSARLAQQASRRGEDFVLMHASDWTPTVATVWPRVLARRFLAWCDEHPKLIKMGDDSVTGAWTTAEKIPVWATVPSLVEHPDVEPSLIGRKTGAGRNRFRIAAVPPPGL
jgi:hypothetical protein